MKNMIINFIDGYLPEKRAEIGNGSSLCELLNDY